MRKVIILFLSVIFAINFTACNKIKKKDVEQVEKEITDSINYPVTIQNIEFQKAPQKVVSMSPALTQMLIDIGEEDKIVGVSEYCTIPEGKEIQRVGSPAKPEIQKIIEISPQIVITQTPFVLSDRVELEAKGINIITVSAPHTYSEMVNNYAMLMKLFKGNSYYEDETTELIKELDTTLNEISESTDKHSFLYIINSEMFIATGETLASNILSVFGENVALNYSDYDMPYEDILKSQPQIIFVGQDVDVTALPDELKELNAVKENKIISLDNTYFEKSTISIIDIVNNVKDKVNELFKETENVQTQVETEATEATLTEN